MSDRTHEIGAELATLSASLRDYVNKIGREFKSADKDSQLHDIAYQTGVYSAYINQRIEQIMLLANELSGAATERKNG